MKKYIVLMICLTAGFSAHAKTTVDDVLSAYFAVKNALANDEKATAQATELYKNLKSFSIKQLNSKQQQVWNAHSASVIKAIQPMLNASSIKEQRELFKEVSVLITKCLKEMKITNGKIFVQYCPMAKAGWLNEVEAIQNPYYGSMMFDCGENKEKI